MRTQQHNVNKPQGAEFAGWEEEKPAKPPSEENSHYNISRVHYALKFVTFLWFLYVLCLLLHSIAYQLITGG